MLPERMQADPGAESAQRQGDRPAIELTNVPSLLHATSAKNNWDLTEPPNARNDSA